MSVPEALCIAIVGAESTGKTTLAATLAQRLGADTGRRVAWVPELLREWCTHSGRTPLAHEQASILRAMHHRIDAAAAAHDLVVCDTTALMTAVYSQIVFNDHSLNERAAQLHRRSMALTLLTAIDLPWVADGLQREGPQVQEPVDTALREQMGLHRIDFAVVSGQGGARVGQALAAVAPLLRTRMALARTGDLSSGLSSGLFTGLTEQSPTSRAWACECCLPDQERALRRQRP